MTVLLMSAGMLTCFGVLLVVRGLQRRPAREAPARFSGIKSRLQRSISPSSRRSRRDISLLALGLAVGFVAFALSGWLVALVVAPIASIGIPRLIAQPKSKETIARLEGLEEWTRVLAGVLAVGIGLEQAIIRTQRSTPAAIQPEVSALIGRLRSRWAAPEALRCFADELNDPTGDLISAALISSAERRGPGLREILDSLAESVSDEVRARRQIEADRAKPRATARWVTILTVAAMAALFLFNGEYLEPYSSPGGQITLIFMLSLYVGALLWMRQISEGKPIPRFLASRP